MQLYSDMEILFFSSLICGPFTIIIISSHFLSVAAMKHVIFLRSRQALLVDVEKWFCSLWILQQ
jgi:hypothetical protein